MTAASGFGGDDVAAPYAAGDRIEVDIDGDVTVQATVSHVVRTESLDPSRRWRVLCRLDNGDGLETPLHCSDDGVGQYVRPATERAPGPLVDRRSDGS